MSINYRLNQYFTDYYIHFVFLSCGSAWLIDFLYTHYALKLDSCDLELLLRPIFKLRTSITVDIICIHSSEVYYVS